MVEPGHNNPPSLIDWTGAVTSQLNDWMKDNPVVATEEAARDAKVLLDRAKLCLKDQEDERDKAVRPLNEQIREINQRYRPSRDLLTKVCHELTRRVTDYLAKQEAKKIKIAEEARKKAEEAEQAARQAEQRERDGIADTDHGGVVDIAGLTKDADAQFTAYRQAERAAALAEKESKVRIGGGFTRALSLRSKETLTVKDAISAISAIGMTPDIEAAILKAARAYRTMTGDLPAGIESTTERAA